MSPALKLCHCGATLMKVNVASCSMRMMIMISMAIIMIMTLTTNILIMTLTTIIMTMTLKTIITIVTLKTIIMTMAIKRGQWPAKHRSWNQQLGRDGLVLWKPLHLWYQIYISFMILWYHYDIMIILWYYMILLW